MPTPYEQFLINQQLEAESERNVNLAKFKEQLAAAIQKAPTVGQQYATSVGLDPTNFGDLINQIVSQTAARIPQNDTSGDINPEQYFTPDVFASGFNDYQSRRREGFNRNVQSAFAPGFDYNMLPDTSDDEIVNQILNEQQQKAGTILNYQQKRGLLNDAGYSAAQQELSGQGSAAKSTLDSLGENVLKSKRADLTSIVADAGNAANSWQLGMSDFDINPYKQRLNEKAASLRDGLGGDVRAALSGTELFDIPSIVAAGGIAQGAQNLTTRSSTDIPFNERRRVSASRGLGSTGAF